MGKRRRTQGRPVNGILLLDKPIGGSSNAALQDVKRIFKAAKAGHTGNLDPLASGMLPLCFGEATKISAFLLDSDKHYFGTCKLGVRTTTADCEGEVIEERSVPELSEAQIEAVLENFRGEIQQIPPMYSALKQNGVPLYKLAREGKVVEREARTVQIYGLTLVQFNGSDELELSVQCSKGTYIRTLVEDIGEALGCGAHLIQLRRTKVGPFEESGMVTMEQIELAAAEGNHALDALLLPMEDALKSWPDIILSENSLFYVLQGQAVQVPQAPSEGLVRLFAQGGRFIGVGQVLDDGRIGPKRLMQQKRA
ncbi:MAG: tRNA pseudouridine(55) synthase TruB [Chromatiales bacterium]|nr:tRNA pseudouridine(55) synthase TruB [Chromatiales bacterium]